MYNSTKQHLPVLLKPSLWYLSTHINLSIVILIMTIQIYLVFITWSMDTLFKIEPIEEEEPVLYAPLILKEAQIPRSVFSNDTGSTEVAKAVY